MKGLLQKLKQDPVLTISAVLAIVSCLIIHPDSAYLGYFNMDTLIMLFCLMLIVAGLKQLNFFAWMGQTVLKKIHSQRGILLTLVFLCFFSSMFITNDVALITFVPFGISMLEMVGMTPSMCFAVVMMTIAANLGSMFTPVGNPQNLYLYAVSGMKIGEFFALMLPLTLLSAVCLFLAVSLFGVRKSESSEKKSKKRDKSTQTSVQKENLRYNSRSGFWLILFFCSILSVTGVISKLMLFVAVVLAVWILDRSVFKRIDYALLGTFCCFFIFIGNMNRMEALREILVQVLAGRECAVAVVLSQIISNVPAAILLSGYTSNIRGLIVGTNLGGLGTLIASMASLISYKQIAVWNPQLRKAYLIVFTGWNVAMLAVLLVGAYLLG